MNYEKAIKLLGYTVSEDLALNKRRAEFFLKTATKQCPLKYKAAATFVIRNS